MNNWQEWRCRHRSHQRALGVAPALGDARRHQRDRELAERGRGELLPGAQHEPGDSPFTPLATNIAGQAGTTSYTDTNAAGAGAALLPRGRYVPVRDSRADSGSFAG